LEKKGNHCKGQDLTPAAQWQFGHKAEKILCAKHGIMSLGKKDFQIFSRIYRKNFPLGNIYFRSQRSTQNIWVSVFWVGAVFSDKF
jgi:hypothetical protein